MASVWSFYSHAPYLPRAWTSLSVAHFLLPFSCTLLCLVRHSTNDLRDEPVRWYFLIGSYLSNLFPFSFVFIPADTPHALDCCSTHRLELLLLLLSFLARCCWNLFSASTMSSWLSRLLTYLVPLSLPFVNAGSLLANSLLSTRDSVPFFSE